MFAVPLLVLALMAGLVAGCSDGDGADSDKLTIYTDQHAELVTALTDAYTAKTGVEFNIQPDATVGQIEAEGDSSRADLFLSEDPGSIAQLNARGLLSPVAPATLAQVPAHLNSSDGHWVAYAARTRVLYYNPDKITAAKLPRTLADIVAPEYKGTFAYAPSGAFVATVQYLIETEGINATTAFLKNLKANGVNEHKNGNVRDTVEAGKHAMGLSNHYYWWVLAAQKGGPDKLTSRIYHFPTVDPGNLVLSSGAGVMASSPKQEEAAAFLRWLTAKDGGQELLSGSDISESGAQYPVAKGTSSAVVGSLADIKSPEFDMDKFADQTQAEELLKSVGMST
jgi:iron(III) transport system substrate-binding protein